MATPTTKAKPKRKQRLTKAKRRKRLEKATAAYFASLSGEPLRHEQKLERAVGHTITRVNYGE